MNTHQLSFRASPSPAGILLAGCLGFFATAPNRAAATNPPAPVRELSAVAQIVFRGTSTLHDFEGRVRSEPFQLLLSTNTWSARTDVIAASMATSNGRRDRAMWIMLATNLYPRLSGQVENAVRGPTSNAPALLSLRIRDQQTNLPVTLTDWTETTNGVRFHATWDISLKQFGLKPPSVMGFIRVGDRVHLDADVTAVPVASPANLHRSRGGTISP